MKMLNEIHSCSKTFKILICTVVGILNFLYYFLLYSDNSGFHLMLMSAIVVTGCKYFNINVIILKF